MGNHDVYAPVLEPWPTASPRSACLVQSPLVFFLACLQKPDCLESIVVKGARDRWLGALETPN